MKRAIVIDTGCLYRLKECCEIFKMISEAGFKYYDYSLYWKDVAEHIGLGPDYKEKALEIKKLGYQYGLKCRQAHATMMNSKYEEDTIKQINNICLEIEIAHILGAKGIVIHPNPYKTIEENCELFKKYFVPLGHKHNINILIENIFIYENDVIMPTCVSKPQGLLSLINMIDDEKVGACIDIGHSCIESLGTSATEMIKTLGDKAYALHIHDNDLHGDTHQVPYTGFINFSEVLQALKDIKYKGDITFEILTCYNRGYCPSMSLPIELFPAFVKLEYEIGKYFVSYLDK